MADSKITALTAISTVDPTADPLVIVDVSDTSMAASGTTKKSTINQLLGAGGTATLASATITGDLTVDTSTLKVDSTNNRVGVNTASPQLPLVVSNSGAQGLEVNPNSTSYSGGIDLLSYNRSTNAYKPLALYGESFAWRTATTGAPTERLFLDSSGNLGLGVTPSANQGKLQINQALGSTMDGALRMTDNATTSFILNNVSSGVSAVWSSGQLAFGTGSNTFSEKMRLDASGNLLVGKTASSTTVAGAQVQPDGTHSAVKTDGNPGFFYNTTTAISGTIALFRSNGVTVGSITQDGTNTSYVTTSDYRLKENVQPLVGGLARISALKPSIYKWKSNGSNGEGFIAHELAEVVPAAVTGHKDAVNADGTINAQGVDLSKVVPVLVAAIQELTARVQTLETR